MLRTRVRAGVTAGWVLSLLFGALLTLVSQLDLYFPQLQPALGARAPVTLRVPYGPRIVGGGQPGHLRLSYEHTRVIVPAGTMLEESNDAHRTAFAYESLRRPPRWDRVASYFGVFFAFCLMLTFYLRRFGQSRVRLLRAQVGIFTVMVASLILAKALLLHTALPEYWLPMGVLPLWVAYAFDRRTAFLISVAVAFTTSSLLRFDIVLLSVLLVRGMATTIIFFDRRKHPRQMFVASTLAGLAGALVYACLMNIFEGRIALLADLSRGLDSNFLACVGGGVASGIFGVTLRELGDRVVGHVSRDHLLDLTDLEHPLLRKIAAEAPGTWQHSRAMANLAEAAASAIHADALLTRVGAYFHDLGKTVQPHYFIENHGTGQKSPHDELSPEVSADAIMAHVVVGTQMLRDGGVPEAVVEFAYTHHGTSVIEYFWSKCLEQGNPNGLTIEHFRYPGLRPPTKETAILMLVDSIEAASRTIWPPEHKQFEELIQRIVFSKLAAGELDDSGLTLEDLRTIIGRTASTLVSMSHGRLKYPWQRKAERDGPPGPGAEPTASPLTPAPGNVTS